MAAFLVNENGHRLPVSLVESVILRSCEDDALDESLEGTMTILINDINNGTEFKEITSELQKGSGDEFQRNVFIDAIKRFDIGLWKSLTLLVVVASLLIYNFIGQQAGFYFAVITLTIMQIWRSGSD